MKKLSLVFMGVLVGALSLTGCSSSPPSGGSDTSVKEESSDKGEQTTWEKIQAQGYITFATEGTYSPYSYHDDNDKLVGYDVEIAEAIADKIGVEAKFTETKWDGIVAGLDAKKYDVIANQVSITDERKEKYLFSVPYTYAYGVVVVNKDNDSIKSFEDLDGAQVSLTTTSNWAELSESYGATIVPTNGFSESIQLVLQNRADATVNDNVTYLDYIKQQPDANVKVAATSEEATESALLVRREDVDLQEKLNSALEELLEDGTITSISEKYFGEDISKGK